MNFVSSVVSPSYDFDGNQLSAGLGQAYAWDAENRLISVEPLVPTANSLKVVNVYDAFSRRVRRTIFTFVNGTWVPSNDEKYIYEGWNVVAVYDASSALTLLRAYTWGVDISGSLQGAGGVGGLLAVSEISNGQVSSSYHYTYDANGNVGQLLSNAAALVAHYEYDAFGGATFTSGSYAGQNEYRFSTMPLDAASGLYYYGYRYYNPGAGRWLSRDPIGERGGVNLHGMVGNSPVNYWDYLGLRCPCSATNPTATMVKDDAGVECCSDEIEVVMIKSEHGLIGHTFLEFSDGYSPGLYPGGGVYSSEGVVYNTPGHDYTVAKPYRACSASAKKLRDSISSHLKDPYHLLNKTPGRNCTGWACDRLSDAGFTPPARGEILGLDPDDIK